MRVRYLSRDLLRRGVCARDTTARYFLIIEYFPGNEGIPHERANRRGEY